MAAVRPGVLNLLQTTVHHSHETVRVSVVVDGSAAAQPFDSRCNRSAHNLRGVAFSPAQNYEVVTTITLVYKIPCVSGRHVFTQLEFSTNVKVI